MCGASRSSGPPPMPLRPEPPPVRVQVPKPAPVVVRRPAPASKPDEDKPRESATFVATIETVSGEARLGEKPAESGKGIAAGQSLSTGRDGYMAVRYPDGSRFELAGDASVSKLF